ncbi:small kinetochore-associated protein isoform X2 [Ascaphus truei]|uniref:small kinetochore-associated protein isoform X2 n=1 Tax=Ascaphus truei TaxID=8439 RepID=UPI003F5AB168
MAALLFSPAESSRLVGREIDDVTATCADPEVTLVIFEKAARRDAEEIAEVETHLNQEGNKLAEMEKSKIPLYKSNITIGADASVPCPKRTRPQNPVIPLFSKDPNIVFSVKAPDMGIFKATNSSKKAVVPKKAAAPTRGAANKFRMEAGLRDKNLLLEAANIGLRSNLTTAQDIIQEMTGQQGALEEEVKELNKRLEKNMIILENRNIDPISGESILACAEETRKSREETKLLTGNLFRELKIFSQTASEQKEIIQTVMSKWKEAEDGRNAFVEEQQAFESELEQFRASLCRAEQLLDL